MLTGTLRFSLLCHISNSFIDGQYTVEPPCASTSRATTFPKYQNFPTHYIRPEPLVSDRDHLGARRFEIFYCF